LLVCSKSNTIQKILPLFPDGDRPTYGFAAAPAGVATNTDTTPLHIVPSVTDLTGEQAGCLRDN